MDVILGGDPLQPPGNPLLKDITIRPDFPDPKTGALSCSDPDVEAEIRELTSDNPSIVLCDPAAFGHGSIGKGYTDGNIPAVTCDTLDPRVSWKMDTLGAVLLHEYTHWLKLMTSVNGGPLPMETDDHEYGVYDCRFELDFSQATDNADSYNWYASEVLWTVLCGTQYQDPVLSDQDDPNCNGTVCTAPKSP